MAKILLIVGTGGFVGTVFRFLLSQFIQTRFFSEFPYGTLGVNLLGCLAIGVVFALSERIHMNPEWRMFLATGICGGFTTFSAFSYETFSLLRHGQFWFASGYIAASVILGLLATYAGYSLIKL